MILNVLINTYLARERRCSLPCPQNNKIVCVINRDLENTLFGRTFSLVTVPVAPVSDFQSSFFVTFIVEVVLEFE